MFLVMPSAVRREIRRNTQKHPSKNPKQYAEIRRNTLSNTPSKNTPSKNTAPTGVGMKGSVNAI